MFRFKWTFVFQRWCPPFPHHILISHPMAFSIFSNKKVSSVKHRSIQWASGQPIWSDIRLLGTLGKWTEFRMEIEGNYRLIVLSWAGHCCLGRIFGHHQHYWWDSFFLSGFDFARTEIEFLAFWYSSILNIALFRLNLQQKAISLEIPLRVYTCVDHENRWRVCHTCAHPIPLDHSTIDFSMIYLTVYERHSLGHFYCWPNIYCST